MYRVYIFEILTIVLMFGEGLDLKYLPSPWGPIYSAFFVFLILAFFSGRKTSLGCAGPTPGIRTGTDTWDSFSGCIYSVFFFRNKLVSN